MTNNDTYNGWKNRETWALQLWLTNDQGLYEMTRERVATAVAGSAGNRPGLAGIAVQNFIEELTDPDDSMWDPAQIISFLSDVGSLYRVDWDEIGAAWLDTISEG